jgi:hypothetical protein
VDRSIDNEIVLELEVVVNDVVVVSSGHPQLLFEDVLVGAVDQGELIQGKVPQHPLPLRLRK